jgi:hypothetical protein
MVDYFSEREGRIPVPDQEEIGTVFWAAFVDHVTTCFNNGSLAEAFPDNCPDAPIPCGINETALKRKFEAHLPGAKYPLAASDLPPTLDALDQVEFFGRYLSKPVSRRWHDFFHHDDLLRFDKEAGIEEYCEEINALLRLCRHPYELKLGPPPHVVRTAPPVLAQIVVSRFQTGDRDLDELLRVACEKFSSPNLATRLDALEKLWDAFERLKTLHSRLNKKASIESILTTAFPEPNLYQRIQEEAKELTQIGNSFMIRHHETDKVKIERPEHVDYLFHRLFALVWAVLKGRRAVH